MYNFDLIYTNVIDNKSSPGPLGCSAVPNAVCQKAASDVSLFALSYVHMFLFHLKVLATNHPHGPWAHNRKYSETTCHGCRYQVGNMDDAQYFTAFCQEELPDPFAASGSSANHPSKLVFLIWDKVASFNTRNL